MPEYETEIKAILSVPSVAAVMPAYEHETEWTKQVRESESDPCYCVESIVAQYIPVLLV